MHKSFFLIVFIAVLSCLSTSLASASPLLPKNQLSDQDKVWLARSMVAEAGWLAERDHVAIAYVLAKRWRQMQQRYPAIQFRDVMFSYVKGLGGGRREYTARQRWIRALRVDLEQPEYWPEQVRWSVHQRWWRSVLMRVEAWLYGRLPDPCRGQAWHWGGTIDTPKENMVPVDCGMTKNTFYRVINN